MNKAKKRVTIKDIANKCQTTANTVSRALRNDPGISAATTQKIQQTAKEMGYIRNGLASAMRSSKSKLISIIVEDVDNPHNSMLIEKMDCILKDEGYDIIILSTQANASKKFRMASLSVSLFVDGILYFPSIDDKAIVDMLKINHIPFVFVERGVDGIEADIVRCDDYQGGVIAADYLLGFGHRSFLYLGGPQKNGAQPLRQTGFVNRLLQCGVQPSDIAVLDEETVYQSIREDRIMDILRNIKFTGAFAFNDQIAYHAINALRYEGRSVPGGVSIIGFDYIKGALAYLQPLTSIASTDMGDMASRIVSLLLRRIHNSDASYVTEILPVSLHEKESTVSAPRFT